MLEEGAQAEVWEQFLSGENELDGVFNVVTELIVGAGANLRYVCGQGLSERSWIFGAQRASVEGRLRTDPRGKVAQLADRVEADYLGLNHLGWLRGLRVGGTDLLPGLLADPARLLAMEEGRLFGADLLQALGAIPNEYLYWYYAQAEALRDVMAADRTRGEHVRARQERFYAAAAAAPGQAARLWAAANEERNRSYFAELRSGERDAADVAAGGYESIAIGLAAALTGGGSRGGGGPARLIVNVPNGTTIPALGPDAVIETVCLVDSQGAVPLPVSRPSEHELGLMCTVKSCERAIVTAALTGSQAAALRAFALHPLVASLGAARALATAAAMPMA